MVSRLDFAKSQDAEEHSATGASASHFSLGWSQCSAVKGSDHAATDAVLIRARDEFRCDLAGEFARSVESANVRESEPVRRGQHSTRASAGEVLTRIGGRVRRGWFYAGRGGVLRRLALVVAPHAVSSNAVVAIARTIRMPALMAL